MDRMKLSESDSLVNYRNPELRMQNDSPSDSSSYLASAVNIYRERIKGEMLLLATSVILLVIATAGERVTFKMAVDRMVPFRFVLIQLIFLTSALIYSAIKHLKLGFTNRIAVKMKEFPPSKLMIMAAIDAIQFAGMAVSAAGVSPTMTVILLHTSTPFLVLGSKYTFPDRKYSLIQMRGVQLIALSVFICLFGSFSHVFFPGTHQSDPSSSLLYVGMAALHGLGTLYKEKSIIEWSQPIDIYCLSSKLYTYQFGLACVLGPLIYLLQGISSNWEGYPLDEFVQNISDGLGCFFGHNPDDSSGYDSSSAICNYSWLLILGYVISNIIVLECIDRVLQTSNQILERVMAAAVFVAFLTLLLYDNDFGLSGCAVDLPNVLAIITLVVGMEIYGRDPEPDVEAVTEFVPI